jgi:hypothetical protein
MREGCAWRGLAKNSEKTVREKKMAPLRQVSLAAASPEIKEIYKQFFGDRDPVAQPGTVTGTPGDYWTTFALVPDLLLQARNSLMALMQPGRKLPAQLRGYQQDGNRRRFEIRVFAAYEGRADGRSSGGKAGGDKELGDQRKIHASRAAVMQATDELVGRNLVEDDTFAALKKHMPDEQIMELFYVIGLWRMHGMIVRALHLEFDNDTTARMVEVPAPPAKK